MPSAREEKTVRECLLQMLCRQYEYRRLWSAAPRNNFSGTMAKAATGVFKLFIT
ncbi:MAG: hypothetical protein HQK94_16160 [Nitrospirae bacterium]|nr:hypothetical protein [Nitrospirota bacterium]MBF0535348.1 hypothetical protein [Nitrospirota bacterium]